MQLDKYWWSLHHPGIAVNKNARISNTVPMGKCQMDPRSSMAKKGNAIADQVRTINRDRAVCTLGKLCDIATALIPGVLQEMFAI
jgi:hypothetical protein